MPLRPPWIALIAALAALLVWITFFWQPASAPPLRAQAPAVAPTGGDFRLTGADGPVALSDFRGKVVALYFGYTFCPDVCPTSLLALAQGFAELTPEELAQTRGLFVTIDPARDTVDVLRVYVPYFHKSFAGLTGTPDEVARVAALYGARYIKQKPNADGHYAVDHTAFTYLIDRDGRLAATLAHGASPQEIRDALRTLLRKGSP